MQEQSTHENPGQEHLMQDKPTQESPTQESPMQQSTAREKASEQDVANSQALLCFSTAPSLEVAEKLAEAVLERQLAACVSFVAGATSVYRWQGAICKDAEVWIMIKTTPQAYGALQQVWQDLHPYDVPELLAVRTTDGLPAYIQWLFSSVASQ